MIAARLVSGRVQAISAAYSGLFVYILITLNNTSFSISCWWGALIFILIPAAIVYIDWGYAKQFYSDYQDYKQWDFFLDVIIIITMSQLVLAYSKGTHHTWQWFALLFLLYIIWDLLNYKAGIVKAYSPFWQLVGDAAALLMFALLSLLSFFNYIDYNMTFFLGSMLVYIFAVVLWHIPNRHRMASVFPYGNINNSAH